MSMTGDEGAFPQIADNQTRREATEELAEYFGGDNDPRSLAKAGRSWDRAVKFYNRWLWKFNRVTDDITLAIPAGETNYAYEYNLPDDFHEPMRVSLVNAAGNTVKRIPFVTYPEYESRFANRSTQSATEPELYTIRAAADEGKILFHRPFGTAVTHPTVRLFYFRRIAQAPDPNDRLRVPPEMDDAIFQRAVLNQNMKERGGENVRPFSNDSTAGLQDLLRKYQDFADKPVIGAI